jgi:hypothetical protein
MSFGARVLILRAYGSGLLVLNRRHGEQYAARVGRSLAPGQKYVPHLALAKATSGSGSWNDVNLGISSLQNSPMMPFQVTKVGLYHKSDLVAEVELKGLADFGHASTL